MSSAIRLSRCTALVIDIRRLTGVAPSAVTRLNHNIGFSSDQGCRAYFGRQRRSHPRLLRLESADKVAPGGNIRSEWCDCRASDHGHSSSQTQSLEEHLAGINDAVARGRRRHVDSTVRRRSTDT
jgi:hypothetical protein